MAAPYQSTAEQSAIRTSLDAIMEDRRDWLLTNKNITASHNSFAFANEAEMQAVFNNISNVYETKINTWLAGIPPSRERAALFSLAYNQTDSNPLLGNKLKGQRGHVLNVS